MSAIAKYVRIRIQICMRIRFSCFACPVCASENTISKFAVVFVTFCFAIVFKFEWFCAHQGWKENAYQDYVESFQNKQTNQGRGTL